MNNQRAVKIIAIIILALIFLGLALYLLFMGNKNGQKSENTSIPVASLPKEKLEYKDREDLVEKLVAKKYNINQNQVQATIAREDDSLSHLKGIVSVENMFEGVFLVAKIDDNWELVWDGKDGNYSCDLSKKYAFPEIMVNDCK